MFRNYLKIAIRNLFRNSVYSFINIGGLAIGLACSVLILLWVWDEISFDRFHENSPQLGQLYFNNHFSDNVSTSQAVPLGPYEFLKTFDSGIKNTCMAYWPSNALLSNGEKKLYQLGRMVTPEFLEMFRFPMLKGSPDKALDEPRSIVITESLSKALFGDSDPLNQMIKLDNTYELKVTGVLKDLPSNSTFQFKYLASWAVYGEQAWAKRDRDNWDNESYPVFVELQPGANLQDINNAIKDLPNQKIKDPEFKREAFILPLSDWHLRSKFENGIQNGGMIEFVRNFSIIAALILIIACINFMNLATARSERRAREVGIRKTVGSLRKELIGQFIGESILITTIAFIIAVVFVEIALPSYNALVDKKLFINYSSPWVWVLAISVIAITGILAGSYPAFYLSSFKPVSVLKGKIQTGSMATTPRKALVILQFFFSVILIFGTIVIYKQIEFTKERSLGYDNENLINIEGNEEMSNNFNTIKQQLLESRLAVSVTSSSSPVTAIYGNNTFDWPGKPQGQTVLFSRVQIGYDYAKTMGIKILEGRDFSEEFKSDSSAMLINKAALEVMGVEKPIGLEVSMWSRKWTIVGVLDNVIMDSPFSQVRPGFFILDNGYRNYVTARLAKTNNMATTLENTKAIFEKLSPSYPLVYEFVDQDFSSKYKSINLVSSLATIFAFLALFITSLGLFGLVTFTAEQRTKEIGIRKIMGATTINIVQLISKDFTRLVLIGFVIAAPLAWWLMNNYLNQFSYRIHIAWWILPATGFIALAVTLLIVCSQALKAAAANPSQSLRSE
jgi:ABC-type antimicrobial peptide transport system permease subunit